MENYTILVSLSDEERAFIAREIAAGNYADEAEALHAGLEALVQEAGLRGLTHNAFDGGKERDIGFKEPDVDAYLGAGHEDLRHHLSRSESSGVSDREIPAIIQSVKAKLRANGAL